jgi:excisionase family DNA binding protein
MCISLKARSVNMKEQFDDNYINIEEAAQYLGIKPVTLRNWIKKGDNNLPAHKVGKQWKFKKNELDAWINSGDSALE